MISLKSPRVACGQGDLNTHFKRTCFDIFHEVSSQDLSTETGEYWGSFTQLNKDTCRSCSWLLLSHAIFAISEYIEFNKCFATVGGFFPQYLDMQLVRCLCRKPLVTSSFCVLELLLTNAQHVTERTVTSGCAVLVEIVQ